ncbi:histamine H3 receptor isoform X2 [Ctenopharyngodon idella]|uniref:histamine H3 receptor isoform X2 n=1 Tax=Ctenopharyngodon idella TaxID=7959 RepID=UPI002230267B|nr:histamine H3 receptor isoform X2 [Ctenopharyngodon idella]
MRHTRLPDILYSTKFNQPDDDFETPEVFPDKCAIRRSANGAFCIPVYMPYILTGKWMLGKGLCKLWLVVDYLLCTASVFNIVLISYDRYLSVTKAVSYRAKQGMIHFAVVKIAAVWILAFLLYGPAILFWEQLTGRSRVPDDECFAEFYYTWYFLLSASVVEFFSPFLSVAFFNISIYLSIRQRRLGSKKESCPPKCQDAAALQGKKTRMSVRICWNSQKLKKTSTSDSEKRSRATVCQCGVFSAHV